MRKSWAVTTKRYVAYIDIMGFKDLVARNPHSSIYSMMKSINNRKKTVASIKWSGLVRADNVRSTTYSDSLIFYSKNSTKDALYALVCAVASITRWLFDQGIPHKGAIAFGTMTLDEENSIFFGQPLIDSYLLQEELNFYGIVLHATVEKEIFSKKIDLNYLLYTHYYLCPFKNGASYHTTICPMSKVEQSSIQKLRLNTSGALRKYIDNTENYLNAVQDNKL